MGNVHMGGISAWHGCIYGFVWEWNEFTSERHTGVKRPSFGVRLSWVQIWQITTISELGSPTCNISIIPLMKLVVVRIKWDEVCGAFIIVPDTCQL